MTEEKIIPTPETPEVENEGVTPTETPEIVNETAPAEDVTPAEETSETAPEAPTAPAAPVRTAPLTALSARTERPSRPQSTDGARSDNRGGGDRGGRRDDRGGRKSGFEPVKKEFEEVLLEVGRVTKVTSGGRQLRFRAAVVIGDRNGRVGFGLGKAREVSIAVEKAVNSAKRNLITVPVENG